MEQLKIASPLTLNCGITLSNRLAKAAMTEGVADENSLPSAQHRASYGRWSEGGWGLLITGNVQVDVRYLGQARDITTEGPADYHKALAAWKTWAKACNSQGTPTIVQLNHPGKQSPVGAGNRGLFEKTISSSAIPLHLGKGPVASLVSSIMFGTPREMNALDIKYVIDGFVFMAQLSFEAGFSGIEIHAAHGYLLAQFLSEISNQRTDEYGGSPTSRAKIVVDIINAVREVVPKTFCIGMKLNSVDHQSALDLQMCNEQLECITKAGIDFLEISGGSYENPTMSTGIDITGKFVSASTAEREAFFLEFAKAIRLNFPNLPLMVTGGFRSRQAMEAAVAGGHCDLIGIARPAALDPWLPKRIILNQELSNKDAKVYARKVQPSWLANIIGIKVIGISAESLWYQHQIQSMGKE